MRRDSRMPAQAWPARDTILEEMQERGWSVDDLAKATAWTREMCDFVLSGRREIGEDEAAALSAGFGASAQFWLNLELSYRRWLRHAKRRATARGEGE